MPNVEVSGAQLFARPLHRMVGRLVTFRSSCLGIERGKMILKVHGMCVLVFGLAQIPIREMRAQRLLSASKVLDGALQPRHGRCRIDARV
jgi:hypothetical protein